MDCQRGKRLGFHLEIAMKDSCSAKCSEWQKMENGRDFHLDMNWKPWQPGAAARAIERTESTFIAARENARRVSVGVSAAAAAGVAAFIVDIWGR